MADDQALPTKKYELLETLARRYDFRTPLDLTPSDAAFQIIARVRKRRSAEFVALSRAMGHADSRDVQVDHVRIRGANGDLILSPSRALSGRNNDFARNNDAFNFTVIILMYTYIIVSRADEKVEMWRPLHPVLKHITVVENQSRAAARLQTWLLPRIPDAEMAVRLEWHAVRQAEPPLPLSAIIEMVSQRHAMWHRVHELRPVFRREAYRREEPRRRKGGKKGGGRKTGQKTLAGEKWFAKESGETVVQPELCSSHASAKGCKMIRYEPGGEV